MTGGTGARTGSDAGRRWWTSRWVLGAALLVVVAIFIIENRQPVEIRLLIPVITMPLWAALTGMVLIGALIGFLLRRR